MEKRLVFGRVFIDEKKAKIMDIILLIAATGGFIFAWFVIIADIIYGGWNSVVIIGLLATILGTWELYEILVDFVKTGEIRWSDPLVRKSRPKNK